MADGHPKIEFRAEPEVAVAFRALGEREGALGELARAVVECDRLTTGCRDGDTFRAWLLGWAQYAHDHPGGASDDETGAEEDEDREDVSDLIAAARDDGYEEGFDEGAAAGYRQCQVDIYRRAEMAEIAADEQHEQEHQARVAALLRQRRERRGL